MTRTPHHISGPVVTRDSTDDARKRGQAGITPHKVVSSPVSRLRLGDGSHFSNVSGSAAAIYLYIVDDDEEVADDSTLYVPGVVLEPTEMFELPPYVLEAGESIWVASDPDESCNFYFNLEHEV